MKNAMTYCLPVLLALCAFTSACGKKQPESAAQGDSGAGLNPVAAALSEPPVIGMIRKAEEQELIRQVNRNKVEALPKEAFSGPPPDPDLQRLMTRQMDAKMKVDDYVDQLKAYQGSPHERKLAAEFVRRSELRHQVRIQKILIRQAEEEKDEAKLAQAKELLALRQAEVKKSEEEWLAVEKGGWREQ